MIAMDKTQGKSRRAKFDWAKTKILLTGGTGSFGRRFTQRMLEFYKPAVIRVFSRDEMKQFEMREQLKDAHIRYFLGDVRDIDRLKRAMEGVDLVIHAAALKQVPACEYNPFEAVRTNINGAENIINAAIDTGVKRVLALSTDKAVNPVNLYGATKLCAEKILIQANSYSGGQTHISCVRYGNVIGSRGSVVPLFLKQRGHGLLTITDDRMTRFWITLNQAVEFVVYAVENMQGGEVFVPKIPSMRVLDLAEAIAPGCKVSRVGVRPGEKVHEILITEEDSHNTFEYPEMYVTYPRFAWWNAKKLKGGKAVPMGFTYASDSNEHWLTTEDLRKILSEEGHALGGR